MKEWLTVITEHTGVVINAIALVVVAIGTIEAFFRGLHATLHPRSSGQADVRDIYLRFARHLVAGLTFQLAADIIATAVAPSWDEVGKLAAVAAIRTFLNYFLERDLEKAQESTSRLPP